MIQEVRGSKQASNDYASWEWCTRTSSTIIWSFQLENPPAKTRRSQGASGHPLTSSSKVGKLNFNKNTVP